MESRDLVTVSLEDHLQNFGGVLVDRRGELGLNIKFYIY